MAYSLYYCKNRYLTNVACVLYLDGMPVGIFKLLKQQPKNLYNLKGGKKECQHLTN